MSPDVYVSATSPQLRALQNAWRWEVGQFGQPSGANEYMAWIRACEHAPGACVGQFGADLSNVFTADSSALQGTFSGHLGIYISGQGKIAGFVFSGIVAGPAARYFRGALPGQQPNFDLKPGEYRLTKTGQLRGLSLFNNPEALTSRGFEAFEVDQSSVPGGLTIEQRGGNLDHFEIIPANNVHIPEGEFRALLGEIEVTPPIFGDPTANGE